MFTEQTWMVGKYIVQDQKSVHRYQSQDSKMHGIFNSVYSSERWRRTQVEKKKGSTEEEVREVEESTKYLKWNHC